MRQTIGTVRHAKAKRQQAAGITPLESCASLGAVAHVRTRDVASATNSGVTYRSCGVHGSTPDNGNKGTDNGNKGTDNGNKSTDNGNKG